jgi:hypothetical protein
VGFFICSACVTTNLLGIGSNFTDAEVVNLLGNALNAVFLITHRIADHFGFKEELEIANRMWVEYGQYRQTA